MYFVRNAKIKLSAPLSQKDKKKEKENRQEGLIEGKRRCNMGGRKRKERERER